MGRADRGKRGEARGIQLGEARGIQIGQERIQRETSRSLFKMGMSADQIALAVNASKQTVLEWLKEA